jgi:Tfp pilus assembly protein PilE
LNNSKGFSLIEVIIIIVVAAIAYTMMFQFFGTFVTESSVPIHRLNHALELKQIAERITENYKQDTTADLNILKNNLTSNPGAYGSNYTVMYNGFIKFVSQNDVAISGGDPEDILKVKIVHDNTSEMITMLFIRE